MTDIKKSREPKDYKERFEFELTVGNNIICQRYFRINNFNPSSLRSYELTDTIRRCVAVIDQDLKDKSQVYLEMYAPKNFATEAEMNTYLADESNRSRLSPGEGLVVRGNTKTDYFYGKNGAVALGYKFDDGELTEATAESNKATYKFAFKVDGREVCTMVWDGYYPKFVRDKIDLSNKRGKFEGEDVGRLSFEQYLLYKMVQGKNDLVYGLIMDICQACSYPENKNYTLSTDGILEGWTDTSNRNLWRLR